MLVPAICTCVVTAAALAPAAMAQKGVLGTGASPSTGIVDEEAGYRYTTLPAGQATVLSKIAMDTGEVARYRYFSERLVIPSVAYDGSPGRLSADGETLILAEPGVRFPQKRSAFAVIDTRRLRVLDRVSFDGTFTYDALSPNGGSIFLIEYTSPRDLTEYLVREYDLVRDRFDPEPIIDPNEGAEEMYGSPVTRVTSPDGRWEYTLYDGREHPFIRALDTERSEAVCIDLESLHRPIYGGTDLETSPDGASLTVVNRGRPVELVDTRTFEVEPASDPAGDPRTPPADEAENDGGGVLGWAVLGGGLAFLVAAVAMFTHRRREPVGEDELERLIDVRTEERDPVR